MAPNVKFTNVEILTLAVFLLAGETKFIDTEDIAVKAHELALGRFTWKKYRDRISLEAVRKRLSDALKPKNGGFLFGSHRKGWMLSQDGFAFCKANIGRLKYANIAREPINLEEQKRNNKERKRMLSSIVFEKLSNNGTNNISSQDAESFFGIDDYVLGKAREQKLSRIVNTFSDDYEIGKVVKLLAVKVRKK